ncbi:PREDICTED: atherin-like [Lepidothrix coronata]|uniref:Atherin-like n=1 Tax=Lepidothrix coronata TaxID=321398 RepID=A0A6J0HFH5_9PASS|nr:PREDICTED: atherin-like [Lepidothrix coronata]
MVVAAARTKRRARAPPGAGGTAAPAGSQAAPAPAPGGDTGGGRLAAAQRGAARLGSAPPPPRGRCPPPGATARRGRPPHAAERPPRRRPAPPGMGVPPPPVPRGRGRALRQRGGSLRGLTGGGGRGRGGAVMLGLPRGRAALSRLIVREGQRRPGRPRREGRALRREGVSRAAGESRTFLRTGRGLAAELHLPPVGECVGPAAAGHLPPRRPEAGGVRVDGALALRLPPLWCGGAGGPRCTFRALCWRSSKRHGRAGGAWAGAGPASSSPCPRVPGLPSAGSAAGLRHRDPGRSGRGCEGSLWPFRKVEDMVLYSALPREPGRWDSRSYTVWKRRSRLWLFKIRLR